MTTHELKGKIVGVEEVPNIEFDFCHEYEMLHSKHIWFRLKGVFKQSVEIPIGFKFLSLASEMTEDKATVIMPKIFPELVDSHYYNYTPKNVFDTFVTALESFKSWCKAEGLVIENPYGINEPEIMTECCNNGIADRWGNEMCCGIPRCNQESYYLNELWQEAQKLVKQYLILVKDK